MPSVVPEPQAQEHPSHGLGAAPTSQAHPCDRILVVDDSHENLCLIESILEAGGYQVQVASDGAAALAAIEANVPDLVLSDVMMPHIDGIELTRHIRQRKTLPFIPILLITAQEQSDVVEGLDAGADDFIQKPVRVAELLARVRSLLRLKQSIEEREQMSRMREDFLYRLTHDLRTPLVALDRMFKLLLRGKYGLFSQQVTAIFNTMQESNQELLQMINMLLDIYRYELGQKALSYTQFNLITLATSVVEELRPLAEEKGLTLDVQPSGEKVDETFVLSAARLEIRRVLVNLIGNAIKFTDTGSVQVGLYRQPEWMDIIVQDTGCGIAPEDIPIAFERSYQGNHRNSGNGLGLYLIHQIVQAHEGTISLESVVGQGSTFTVRLPIPA